MIRGRFGGPEPRGPEAGELTETSVFSFERHFDFSSVKIFWKRNKNTDLKFIILVQSSWVEPSIKSNFRMKYAVVAIDAIGGPVTTHTKWSLLDRN